MEMTTTDRKTFYHYCFTTALEGGIGYWSVAKEYSWSTHGSFAFGLQQTNQDDIDEFYAILESSEDDWGVSYAYIAENPDPPYQGQAGMHHITKTQSLRVDLSVIERGVNMLIDNVIAATKSEDEDAAFSRKYLRQFVVQWMTNGDEGDSDADVADMVVQLGLFGELVYS